MTTGATLSGRSRMLRALAKFRELRPGPFTVEEVADWMMAAGLGDEVPGIRHSLAAGDAWDAIFDRLDSTDGWPPTPPSHEITVEIEVDP